MRTAALASVLVCCLLLVACSGQREAPPAGDPSHAITLALVNGTVIDGTGADPVAGAVVLIAGDRIAAVGPHDRVAVPDDVTTIDVAGATILPGFINAHVHDAFDADRLAAWAQAGVTTVRDEGYFSSSGLERQLAWRDRLAEDPGYARLISAGHMLCLPGGYGHFEVDSPRAVRDYVKDAAGWGVDQIKFAMEDGYGQWTGLPVFEQDMIDAIVEAAHARSLPVSVHVCEGRYLPHVLDAGVDDIAHLQYDGVSDALIQRMVDQDVTVVTTLTVLDAFGALRGGQANLRRYVAAGVRIAMGNDYTAVPQNNFDHFELGMPMHELRKMQEAGMTPVQIIVAATQNAAYVCGLARETGTLTPGKLADILVVNGDPLEDLEVLTDVRVVVHGGEVIREE